MTMNGHRILEEETAWAEIAADMLGDEPDLVSVSRLIGDSRVYRHGGRAAKIRSRDTHLPPGVNALEEQAQILRRTGLDVEYSSRGSWEIMSMPWLEGDSLTSASDGRSFRDRARLARALIRELARLHRAGVAHGDLHPDNIIVGPQGIRLLDFDRAVTGKGLRLWGVELRSRSAPEPPTHPLWRLLLSLLFPGLRRARTRIQALRPRKSRVATTPADRAPEAEPEDDLALLRRAWHLAKDPNANAEGGVAYYAFTYKGVHFPGDRPWYLRWEPIRRGVDFTEKKLVELGCNMGLLSSFAMIHGARAAVGVDYDHRAVESAKLVARALGSGAQFAQADLSADAAWEEQLGPGDIVAALSLMHWLSPAAQERTLRFLGRHREVLYEGHDTPEVEMNRLKKAGFRDIRILARTERDRVLFHGLR